MVLWYVALALVGLLAAYTVWRVARSRVSARHADRALRDGPPVGDEGRRGDGS